MKGITFAFALLLFTSLAIAKPTTPEPPKKPEREQYPDLNYVSNWGRMTIDRNTGEIILREHPQWDGDARFVTSSKVYVVWYWKEDGKAAPGIYDLNKDGTLSSP